VAQRSSLDHGATVRQCAFSHRFLAMPTFETTWIMFGKAAGVRGERVPNTNIDVRLGQGRGCRASHLLVFNEHGTLPLGHQLGKRPVERIAAKLQLGRSVQGLFGIVQPWFCNLRVA
jgi:hypothetical protein